MNGGVIFSECKWARDGINPIYQLCSMADPMTDPGATFGGPSTLNSVEAQNLAFWSSKHVSEMLLENRHTDLRIAGDFHPQGAITTWT